MDSAYKHAQLLFNYHDKKLRKLINEDTSKASLLQKESPADKMKRIMGENLIE